MRVSIIGTGYVGLVTGACLADQGHCVTCVDTDAGKVESIRRGVPPIHERGLDEVLRRTAGKRLSATTELAPAVLDSDLTLIAVGTPFDGKTIDLAAIREASRQVGDALRHKPSYHAVVVKSTVVPGTTDSVVRPILETASGKLAGNDFGLGMNPEFLSEGEAIDEFMHPDRVVLGGMDARSVAVQDELYAFLNGVPRLRTNVRTAEMIKYASNALLATAISFANEIGNLCAAVGDVDVTDVMHGVHLSRYITARREDGSAVMPGIAAFLKAGCGFGGSCLPKDVRALIADGAARGVDMRLLESVMGVNDAQPGVLVGLLRKHFPDLSGVRVAVLGLAFKPETDDVRQSPAIPVVAQLLALGAKVSAYDPAALAEARKAFGIAGPDLRENLEAAVADADAVIVITSWAEFQKLPEVLDRLGRRPLVIDGRRMFQKQAFARYEGVGC